MLTEAEFNEAAERYLNMVYRIALNWFGNVPDAEDAAQEVMLRLWRSGPPPGAETFTMRTTPPIESILESMRRSIILRAHLPE